MHLETLQGNCIDETITQSTYQGNTSTTYSISKQTITKRKGALVDRGANGSIAGADVRVLATLEDLKVNVEGKDNH